ncbi:MAG: DUF1801 domain-containing protein [Putridiphycobacter sp.]
MEADFFFENLNTWKAELTLLREIVLDCNLQETIKWKQPCYTENGKNILMVSKFKNYCAINFLNGSLLSDPEKLLIQPGENAQFGRQLRFTTLADIQSLTPTIKAYIFEAIENERMGLKVEPKKVKDYHIPPELNDLLNSDAKFNSAWKKLTPGRQKGYLIFFDSAKQSKTKISRIEKYKPRILDGFGIHDCVCGLSKKMPNCDGSHKSLKS